MRLWLVETLMRDCNLASLTFIITLVESNRTKFAWRLWWWGRDTDLNWEKGSKQADPPSPWMPLCCSPLSSPPWTPWNPSAGQKKTSQPQNYPRGFSGSQNSPSTTHFSAPSSRRFWGSGPSASPPENSQRTASQNHCSSAPSLQTPPSQFSPSTTLVWVLSSLPTLVAWLWSEEGQALRRCHHSCCCCCNCSSHQACYPFWVWSFCPRRWWCRWWCCFCLC